MKKTTFVCLIAVGLFSLSACSKERTFKYERYQNMLAKKEFFPKETKVHVDIDINGEKTTEELTYSVKEGRWIGTVVEKNDDEEIETTIYKALNIIPYVSTLYGNAEYLNKDVDDIYKFYASKEEYRIVNKIAIKETTSEGEIKFNKDGLATYSFFVEKDKDGSAIHQETKLYTYSM